MKLKVDLKNLKQCRDNLKTLKKDMPKQLEQMVVAEGVKFVKEAKRIVDAEKIYASRYYKKSFHSDDGAKFEGNKIKVVIGNTANYASYIEKGFRSHFVPGYWQNNVFVYDRNAKKGMIVGSYKIKETKCKDGRIFKRAVPTGTVAGRWVIKRAIRQVKLTQKARFERKMKNFIESTLRRGL